MAKNTFVMLAHKYNSHKHQIGGWYASEKLDGQRAYWVPETRGMKKADVSFSGALNPEHVSTGLWSRLGNVIHAPGTFTEQLPCDYSLDGELYMEGRFRQDLRSIISRYEPDNRWDQVGYNVFDAPSLDKVFHDTYMFLSIVKEQGQVFKGRIHLHHQERLPSATDEALARLEELLEAVVANGGEGVMLRNPWSVWSPRRSWDLLKVKPFDDAEGIVTGYTTGRQTDKGSKLLGKMGALVLALDNGKRLELSGFTEDERTLYYVPGHESHTDLGQHVSPYVWAMHHPEQELPEWAECTAFPRGSVVTFKYRGLTKDDIPSEARYWRKHDGE